MLIWGQLVGNFTARLLILLEASTCAADAEGNPFKNLPHARKSDAKVDIKVPNGFHKTPRSTSSSMLSATMILSHHFRFS